MILPVLQLRELAVCRCIDCVFNSALGYFLITISDFVGRRAVKGFAGQSECNVDAPGICRENDQGNAGKGYGGEPGERITG